MQRQGTARFGAQSCSYQQGAYDYNTKSKASWYWSRKFGATKRLGCNYFVFTDYQKWCFGVFTEGHR